MTKTIETLIVDIQEVITGNGGWTETINDYFKENLGEVLKSRFNPEPRDNKTLRMSSIGQPCARRLWYGMNLPDSTHASVNPSDTLKFLYGDILEELILALAVAAGHRVEGQQDELSILGIKGHRDAIIDGVTVDVKSASSFAFEKKFVNHLSDDTDDFGYLTQLASYVKAGEDDPLVTDKDGGAFLVVDKQHGHLILDYHNFREEGRLDDVEKMIAHRKEMVKKPDVPTRGFDPQPSGKSGNLELPFNCTFCEFKKECHPTTRTFLYKQGNKHKKVYLTHVAREPKVDEVK